MGARSRPGANNLPEQATSFLGCEAEVAALTAALSSARFITVTGVGGVGKTRLALRVAAEILPWYVDGAWLCDLAPLADAGAVAPTIAAVLSVYQTATTTPTCSRHRWGCSWSHTRRPLDRSQTQWQPWRTASRR